MTEELITGTHKKIIKDMEAFSTKSGMSLDLIGRKAVKDNNLYRRLSEGKSMTVKAMDDLYSFFKTNQNDKANGKNRPQISGSNSGTGPRRGAASGSGGQLETNP